MTFSVKVRYKNGPWKVYHNVAAASFREAERSIIRRAAGTQGPSVSLGDYDAKAYRSDAKSVWRKT